MPNHGGYVSQRQAGFFHSAGGRRAGISEASVARWDAETKGKHLPKKAPTRDRASMRALKAHGRR
jgi:hypothetical protein